MNLPLPFPDALQEFRVATSGLSAQNGMHSAASVNAVTKSGTNRFSGNAFEFLRHHRFNATSPLPRIGADGERVDDGLKRNQFGGTLGGPIVRDRLFFFGAYQGTDPGSGRPTNIAFVPTAAMLAGDFTTFASPACNGGRQVTLRAPFVEQPDRPGALQPGGAEPRQAPARRTTDPCGQITFDVQRRDETADDRSDRLPVERQPFPLRPLLGDAIHAAAWLRRRVGQHPEDQRSSAADDMVALDHARCDTRCSARRSVNALRFAHEHSKV